VPEGIDHRYSPGVAAVGKIFYILREHKKKSVAARPRSTEKEEDEEAQKLNWIGTDLQVLQGFFRFAHGFFKFRCQVQELVVFLVPFQDVELSL
jgi:hypothetical protein